MLLLYKCNPLKFFLSELPLGCLLRLQYKPAGDLKSPSNLEMGQYLIGELYAHKNIAALNQGS